MQFSNYSRNAILSLKCTSNAHWDSCVGRPLGSWHWNIAGKTHERSILLLPHAGCSWQLFGTFRREVTSDLNILLISLRCGCGWWLSCILHILWMAVRRSALLSDFLETIEPRTEGQRTLHFPPCSQSKDAALEYTVVGLWKKVSQLNPPPTGSHLTIVQGFRMFRFNTWLEKSVQRCPKIRQSEMNWEWNLSGAYSIIGVLRLISLHAAQWKIQSDCYKIS